MNCPGTCLSPVPHPLLSCPDCCQQQTQQHICRFYKLLGVNSVDVLGQSTAFSLLASPGSFWAFISYNPWAGTCWLETLVSVVETHCDEELFVGYKQLNWGNNTHSEQTSNPRVRFITRHPSDVNQDFKRQVCCQFGLLSTNLTCTLEPTQYFVTLRLLKTSL